MLEGELKFSDESELAAHIREALGVGPHDKIEVTTPQFNRTDGNKVAWRPRDAAQLDEIKKLSEDVLERMGVGVWNKGEGWVHYLFPCEWYECIPAGYQIVGINGEEEAFELDVTDNDRRFGFLPYGWVAGDLEAWRKANCKREG